MINKKASDLLNMMCIEKEAILVVPGAVIGGLVGAASKDTNKKGEKKTTGQRLAKGALIGGGIGLGADAAIIGSALLTAHNVGKRVIKRAYEDHLSEVIVKEAGLEDVLNTVKNVAKKEW